MKALQKLFLSTVLTSLLIISSGASLIYAQSTSVSNPVDREETTSVATDEFTGTLTRKDGNRLVVEINPQNTRELTVPAGINISRNGVEANLESLEVGDQLTVTIIEQTQEIIAIQAVDNSLLDLMRLLAVGLPILLILGLLIYLLTRGSNRGFVKTTKTVGMNS